MIKNITLVLFTLLVFSVKPKAQTATFVVTTNGTTPAMDSAIHFATDTWSEYLQSSIPIKVHVAYINFPGFLGLTISNARKDFSGTPHPKVWYPTSLANAITNTEWNMGEPDMEIFISSVANWYFGTDGNPASNQQDFVSVMMHEIGHGLGMTSLFNVEGGLGSVGELSPPILPSTFMFNDLEGLPGIYDLFIINGAGKTLIDTMDFPNNSVLLKEQLTSDNLFFSGDSARAGNNNFLPKLYAPSVFDFGSSCSHLNQANYEGTINGLMTPFSSAGTVNQAPGPVFLGILYDLGWNRSGTTALKESDDLVSTLSVAPNPFSFSTHIQYQLDHSAQVQLTIFNQLGQIVEQFPQTQQNAGLQQLSWDGAKYPQGIYYYQLLADHQKIAGRLVKN